MDFPKDYSAPENLRETLHGMYRLDESSSDDPDIDIVFVPGLGTDPVKCWDYCGPKKRGNASKDGEQVKFNWASDTKGLNAIASSKARILCFAYASAWKGRFKVKTSFSSLAMDLCESLKAIRQNKNEEWRPIIFIGHSMGGLVIAEAMNELHRRQDKYGDILTNITACLFFGVPFGGTPLASSALKYALIAEHFGEFHTDILSIMEPQPSNARLQKLCDDFKELAVRVHPNIDLRCFYESENIDYGNALATSLPFLKEAAAVVVNNTWGRQMMVTPDSASAILPTGKNAGFRLIGDHSDLVKFSGDPGSDGNYSTVCAQLSDCIKKAPGHAKKRQGASRQTSIEPWALWNLKKRLQPSGDHILETTPRRVDPESWFLQEEVYTSWEKFSPRGLSCLWLVGKPGIGRTSIVSSALEKIRSSLAAKKGEQGHHLPLIASFFCDSTAAGSEPEELLKALMLQLIEQNPLTADHAKPFTQMGQNSTKKEDRALDADTSATMNIFNLWGCLDRILRDEAFAHMYIVINNIHLLAPGLQTSLLINQMHDHFSDPKRSEMESRRWLFTCLEGDDQKRFGKLIDAGHSQVVDLSGPKFESKVSNSLENHVMTQVEKLRQEKDYSRDQVYMIQDLMRSRAANKHWIDIQYIRLKALDNGSSLEAITEILNPDTTINLRNLKRTCWLTIFEQNPKDSHSLKDLLSALALAFRPPTVDELAMLSGIRDPARVQTLAERCKPMVQSVPLTNNTQGFEFSNASLKVDFLWESNEGLNAKDKTDPQIQRFHGVLAWRCFSSMEATQNVPSQTTVRGEQGVAGPSSGSSDEETTATAATADYHSSFWMQHAQLGKRELAKDLIRELPSFWQEGSPLRERWLASHPLQPPSGHIISHFGMTALHAAAMFGYGGLVRELIHCGHKGDLILFNDNGYTPLHIAALYNHSDTMRTLLGAMEKAHIDTSREETGTALHAAATRGHIEAMNILLDCGADPNAFCTTHGPVINAAILSGNNEAVQLLLHHERHSLELHAHDARTTPPLALAAFMSKKKVFHDILVEGKKKWTRNDYEAALDKACFTERKDSVDVLLEEARNFLNDDTLRKCLLVAAVEQNWSCVEMISNAEPGLAGDEIFYLAAVTTREGDASQIAAKRVLHETWRTAKDSISPKVLSASLYQAADNEKYNTVQWLLEVCNADPNTAVATFPNQSILPNVCFKNDPKQRFGNALAAAAWDGTVLIVDTLLKFGAKVDTDDGCPLQYAAEQGRVEVVRTLLRTGADINRIPGCGKAEANYQGPPFSDGTALHAACRAGHTEVVKILLEHDTPANPNLGRGTYQSPILAATKLNQPQILELLLKAKVDVTVCGSGDMSTPLINAAFSMLAEAVESLIEAGADVNQVDANHDTAIILAARAGKADTLRLLIKHRADLLYENPRKESALTTAARHGHVECFQILAEAVAPLFRALKQVARANSTMRALLGHPGGDYKFYDEEAIQPIMAQRDEAIRTVKETEQIRAERRRMEEAVDSAKKEASTHKREKEMIRRDWQEYREKTDLHQQHYDASIEGFNSVKGVRDQLNRELEGTKSELARSKEECAAQRAAAEDARKETVEEKQKHDGTLDLYRVFRASHDKEIKALRDKIDELKIETERRASMRGSDSDSLGAQEQDGRPTRPILGTGKRESKLAQSMSAIFKKGGGDSGV